MKQTRTCKQCGQTFWFRKQRREIFCNRRCYGDWSAADYASKFPPKVKKSQQFKPGDRPWNKGKSGWTTKEIAKLKLMFAIAPNKQLVEEFAPHPWSSICWMAANLGLRKRKNWKDIARSHSPVFRLPISPVDTKPVRPWS